MRPRVIVWELDEYVLGPHGYVPLRYLERIAIALDGGATEREAYRLAAAEHQAEDAGGYVPGAEHRAR